MPGFVPDAGELVWLTFDPQAGHEQAGRRPALILTPQTYNRRSGLAIACPVTSQVKGYPFEVSIPDGCGIQGVILSDQIKSVDWKARRAERIGMLPESVLSDLRARLAPLLGY